MARKIENAMVGAIVRREKWSGGNTIVEPERRQDGKPLARVLLHGNHIATIGYTDAEVPYNVSVCLCGWNTPTTRSRLSAIIQALATPYDKITNGEQFRARYPSGLGVSSRGGVIRIHDACGETAITETGWHSVIL
jgi:hypothetical protein